MVADCTKVSGLKRMCTVAEPRVEAKKWHLVRIR